MTKISAMLENLIKQVSYTLQCLLFIFFAVGLNSCEFDSVDENYVYLEKPKDEIQLGIDLAGVNPSELIYIYNKSYFTYSLFTDGKDVLVRQFFLDGQPIETDQQTGGAYLNISDSEIHDLQLVIALRTGTGSLADYAMYEMYTGEFTFKIKAIPYSDNLNVRETTDSNNNLKLEWDKPSGFEVAGYSIYKGDSMDGVLLAIINNPNKTYFVDIDYAYGYKSYTIVANIQNSYNLTVQDHISVNYWNMTQDHFETQRIATNEASIKWKNPNPFPCKYVLTYGFNKEKVIIDRGVNEAIIPIGDFPTWSESFSLYIIPESARINGYEDYSFVSGGYRDKNFRAISSNVNLTNNKLHALNFDSFDSYDISTMKETSSTNHNLTLHTGCIVKVSKNGIVAMNDMFGFVHVYSDYTLKNKMTKMEIGSYPFQFVGSDKLLIEEISGFKIFDIKTNRVVTSKFWKSEVTGEAIAVKTSVSSDGRYLYVICWDYSGSSEKQWIELYVIGTDNTLKLLETAASSMNIKYIHFHPIKNNEAIIQYSPDNENKFEIIDILTKDKKEVKGEFMHVDPFTGNLLFRGEEYRKDEYNLYVWDKDYLNEKIKIKLANINPWAYSSLMNNILFFNGYYVDLSNLKEWN